MLDLSVIFNNAYSFFTLFLLILSSSFVIIPGISILIASYASFAPSIEDLLFIMFIVLIASLIGDYSTYFLARKFSDKLKNFLIRFEWYAKNERKTYLSLKKHEFLFVFLSRFLVIGAGPVINYLSGFEKLNAKKFVTAVFFGEAVYSVMYALIGYIFKDTWTELVSTVQYAIVALALIAIALYLLYKTTKFTKQNI